MNGPVVVVGAGGFGREVLDVIAAMNEDIEAEKLDVIGVLDDDPRDRDLDLLKARQCPYLGTVDDWVRTRGGSDFIIGIGRPQVRQAIAHKFETVQGRAAIAIHPTASVGFGVVIGAGTVICAGVRLTNNIRIGRHVHLNLNVTVGHDVTIGDYVSVNPLVAVSGGCSIRDRVLVGTGSVVLQGLEAGADCVIGASACVVKDVPAGTTVKGVPAR